MKNSLFKQVMALALPVAMQSVLVSLLGISDVFMVTGLGTASVAAIGLGAKLHFVLMMIMASLGAAVSILVAQHYGRKNTEASQGLLALGTSVGLLLMVPIGIALFVLPTHLLSLLSQDVELINLGATYLRLTVPLLFFTHIIICYESALRARNETLFPLVLAAIAIVLNIILNYLLIHGVGPFPKLGVAGVALASDIARCVQVVLLLMYLGHCNHMFALRRLLHSGQQARKFMGQFFTTAWPLTVNFTIWGAGTFVYHGIASAKGTEALASLSLISPIEGLYHSLFFGLITACSILIGQNLGRNDFGMAKYLAKKFCIFAPLGSFVFGLLTLAASPIFLPWLLDPSDSLYHLCMQLLWVMCLTFWIKVLNMTVVIGVLRAGGDSKYVLAVDMTTMWMLGIPAAFIAAFVFDLSYVWVYSMVLVEEVVKAIILSCRAAQGYWLKNLTADSDEDANVETEQFSAQV
jgi:putative MATE family efflux protein